MIFSVDNYRELIAVSQMRNKLLNALYLAEEIGNNIIYDAPVEEQKNLMVQLFSDIVDLIVSDDNNDILLKDNTQETTVMFVKGVDGIMHWVGTPTNRFEDVHKHIISEDAHKLFVAKLEKGDVPYPPLLLWHKAEWEVGTTDWVSYDDRGFLVAGGQIYPQYHNLVKELQQNDPLGMSHGMPVTDLRLEKSVTEKGEYLTIMEYVSKEFTLLPVIEAANKLTQIGV